MNEYEEFLTESRPMLERARGLLRTHPPSEVYAGLRDDLRLAVVATMLSDGVSAERMIETLSDTVLAMVVTLAEVTPGAEVIT